MNFWKIFLHLVIIYSLLFTVFFLTSEVIPIGLPISDVLILLSAGLLISIITLFFFHWGRKKDEKSSTMLTLAAFGIKMLLNLVLILIYFLLSKIDGIKFIVSFFIIYLSFTVYLMWIFTKTLKFNKIEK